MYLPTEPDVILAQRATVLGCAPDCWHCRFWARQNNATFPFTAARALATPAEAPGPPPGRVSAGIGGAQGRQRGKKCDSGPVQAPPTSEVGR